MTNNKHIVFSVVNDLNYDQRMQKIATSLHNAGYTVTLIGREMKNSLPLKKQVFHQKRFRLFFSKGKLFYIEYNIRLFFHFLFHSTYDVFGAVDLDTLLAHFLAAKIKRKPHTYDAHEYFAELPEVVERPLVKKTWKSLEKWIVPRTRYAYTINHSYAKLFKTQYGTDFEIVRNASVLKEEEEMPVPDEKAEKYILYQGAVNIGRGVEEMIEAMQYISCKLYICGKGDVYNDCVELVDKLNLNDKVCFFGFVEPEKLRDFTRNAILGFTFFTNHGLSYYLSLANRFFDYFHAGIPQLCINFPEYRRINEEFEIAILLDDLKPENIARAANRLLEDEELYKRLQQNCLEARKHINWQAQEQNLLKVYQKLFEENS